MSAHRSLGSLHPEPRSEPQAGIETLAKTSLGRDEQWEMYRFMRLNRMLEETMGKLFRRGKIIGGSYSSLGQEATSVGSAWALGEGDFIGPMIRNLGAELVRGLTPREFISLHMGRATSPNRAKDNLPPTDLERGIVGPIAMLGALIPVMGGITLAGRMRGETPAAITWIGDGGSSTGDFHEALNFLAVFRLPVVVIAENNGYAYSTPTHRQMRIKDIAVRAAGYGMPGEVVDGNDVLAVYEATRRAVERARAGSGPTLLEAKTFRRKGHAEHDDASYVPEELRQHWEAKDPLARFERHLTAHGFAEESDFEALGKEIEAGLEADVEAAMAAPFPEGREAEDGLYEPLPQTDGPQPGEEGA